MSVLLFYIPINRATTYLVVINISTVHKQPHLILINLKGKYYPPPPPTEKMEGLERLELASLYRWESELGPPDSLNSRYS